MARKILIVDDAAINRQLLKYGLSKDYDIIEAKNGSEALEIIQQSHKEISAVLLDIVMPVMDGYDVLQEVRADPQKSHLPIIVITGSEDEDARIRALSYGANDFVAKPYNIEIIKHCLRNNIALNETASIVNAIQRDKLTGIYNREFFFQKAEEVIERAEPGSYILTCFDIDNFKIINDQYGTAEGDRILKHIGGELRKAFEAENGICGRITGDNFAGIYPNRPDVIERMNNVYMPRMTPDNISTNMTYSIGRYVINDCSLTVSSIYDRAYIAKQSVKGRYDNHVAYFDDSMLKALVTEQQIISDMHAAIAENQFEVWYQPQYNHTVGALIGAEALVRWRHPEKGLVVPGEFIPIFEKNGFIYELDKYVWESACRALRDWINAGRDPLPISVNVSRYDVFKEDLVDVLCGLLKRYDLPVRLLRLEITESAFATSSRQIIAIVRQLLEKGFVIEIDDFGSGYSSLNTLKDVPATVLKLDMRFLSDTENAGRGGNILESIVRMAKWLGMDVIAEGVETREQADYLRSIGCYYMQGFLYERPVPLAQYEALLIDAANVNRLKKLEEIPYKNVEILWSPDSLDTLIFNQYCGAACIFEYHEGMTEIVRVNDKFAKEIGGAGCTVDFVFNIRWEDHLAERDLSAMHAAIQRAIETGDDVTFEAEYAGLPGDNEKTYLRTTFRLLAQATDRNLLYCISENITRQRVLERKERETAAQMQAILENANGGVSAATFINGRIGYLFVNDEYYSMLGYTREQFHAELDNGLMDLVEPEDRHIIHEAVEHVEQTGARTQITYRARKRDGSRIVMKTSGSVCYLEGSETPIHIAVTIDITDERDKEDMLRRANEQTEALMKDMYSGVTAIVLEDGEVRLLLSNDKYYEIIGYTRPQAAEEINDLFETIYAEDRERAQQLMLETFRTKQPSLTELRIIRRDGSMRWILVQLSITRFTGVEQDVQICVYSDITVQKEMERKLRETGTQLKLLADSIPGGIATFECAPSDSPQPRIVLRYFNDGFCRLFNMDRDQYPDLETLDPLKVVFEQDRAALNEQVAALLQNDTPMDLIYRAHIRGEDYKWINLKAAVCARQNGIVTVNAILLDMTAQYAATEQLRISAEEYRLATQHSGNVIGRFSFSDRTLTISAEAAAKSGFPERLSDIPYEQIRQNLLAPESESAFVEFFEEIIHGSISGMGLFRCLVNSDYRWLEAHYSTIFNDSGKPVFAVVSFFDVTERKEKEIVYKKWQHSLQARKPESYTLYHCNLSRNATFDTAEGELLKIRFDPSLFSFNARTQAYVEQYVCQEDRERYLALLNSDSLIDHYRNGKRYDTLEYREVLPDGQERWIRLTIELVEYPNSNDIEAYLMFEDIDEIKREELRIKERAELDPLTGALNREAFISRVIRLTHASEPHQQHALLMLDIDGFKLVNDALGHAVGDRTLVTIAESLQGILRKDDYLGRLGGDEFMILLRDIPDDMMAVSKARQICDLVHKTFNLDVIISASVGIVVWPRDGLDFETLYKKADITMYHVKGHGKDNYAVYHDGINDDLFAQDAEEGNQSVQKEARRRMLIVSGKQNEYAMLAGVFASDFRIEKATDANTALARLRYYGSAISVILLDVMRQSVESLDILERIQNSTELRALPVVALVDADDREMCLRVMQCGAADFIVRPLDPDILRIRVQTAISKAENERLRAKRSLMELQSNESQRYKIALEQCGILVIEHDWVKGTFVYDPGMSAYIAGDFNDRKLWHILLSDMVAETPTVQKMQTLVHDLAEDKERTQCKATVRLRTRLDGYHCFEMNIYKQVNEFGLADRMILTFIDRDAQAQP